MTDMPKVILEAINLTKSFPGVRALDGASLRLVGGQLTALLGENGAGKSTLVSILGGILQQDNGAVLLDGREVRLRSPREATDSGIVIISQELTLLPLLSVAENVFLGREPLGIGGLIDFSRMRLETNSLLKRLDLHVSATTLVGTLRPGQQQVVEIARALLAEARVLILDEPTSSLSKREVDVLFNVIADLKRQGVAIVYITHKLEEIDQIADNITVMRDGRVVCAEPCGVLTHDEIVRHMAGREPAAPIPMAPARIGHELLRVEKLSLRRRGPGRAMLVDSVDLRLDGGEVLGIFGLVGAGRTELIEIMFGLHRKWATGEIFVEGRRVDFRSPADAIAHGLALAPEDRKNEGLLLEMSVLANASLASLDRTLRSGLVDRMTEIGHVLPYLERFRVKTPSLHQLVRNLSGGNQQKVILAKWLAATPKVLLLDEPTRGIDINAKREIYAFIRELAQAGLGVIVVSSELSEVIAVSDRIAVMCEGRKTAEFPRGAADMNTVLRAALPQSELTAI